MFLVDSIAAIRKFNRLMFGVGIVFGLGWALLADPAASRICGAVSVLAGLFGGLGGFRIEALQRPRRLGAKHRRALLETLKTIPKGSIEVRVCASDFEAIDLSAQVAGVLTDAGWSARQARTVPHPTRDGLAVGVIGTDAQAADRARELIDAFTKAGFEMDQAAVPIGGVSIELVAVLIGPKPER